VLHCGSPLAASFGLGVPLLLKAVEEVNMTEVSALDVVVDYRDNTIATPGLHPGVISDVVILDKVMPGAKHPMLGIVVDLADQQDTYDDPVKVKIEVMQSAVLGSNLRDIFERLGFKPAKEGRFTLRSLVGTEVDVFVTHHAGKNRNFTFPNVIPKDLNARGKGVDRPTATEVDNTIVVEGKWGRRQRERAR
jgi:hypothetical protein